MDKDDSIDIARRPATPTEVPVEKYAEKDIPYSADNVTVLEDNSDVATKA